MNMIKPLQRWFGLDPVHIVDPEPEADIPVVWIHGANQSSMSFGYLVMCTGFQNNHFINYSNTKRFYDVLDDIIADLKTIGPCMIVGHSLGGLHAVHLTKHVRVLGGVSISTPFRGSATADWAKYIVPHYPIFRDVGRRAPAILEADQIELDVPWTQIVSTKGGVPYHNGPNDGVCTIDSMSNRTDCANVEVECTHYEVMCHNTVVEEIKKIHKKVRKKVDF